MNTLRSGIAGTLIVGGLLTAVGAVEDFRPEHAPILCNTDAYMVAHHDKCFKKKVSGTTELVLLGGLAALGSGFLILSLSPEFDTVPSAPRPPES